MTPLTRRAIAWSLVFASLPACRSHGTPSEARPDAHAARPESPTPVPDLVLDAAAAPAPHVLAHEGVPSAAPDGGSVPFEGFAGAADPATVRHLCDATVARVERNRGGSTLSFRVWFEGGGRGLFKPQQRAEVANFRAELGAYRLSRLLGLHRVPPACGRRVDRALLQTAADRSGDAPFSERVMHELLGRDDSVPGAMLYWIPGPLEPVPGADRWAAMLDLNQPLAPSDVETAADLSRLILFDFVTDNVDSWSGGNILRQHLGGRDPGPMLFMDNGASFSVGEEDLGARPREQAERLAQVQRLPRALLAALRGLTAETVGAAMREDPLGPVLGAAQIHAVLTRRDRVIAHADALIHDRGEGAVVVFP